jgi:hypothetical protein
MTLTNVRKITNANKKWKEKATEETKNQKRKHAAGLNVMAMGIYYEALMRWIGNANSVMAMSSTFVDKRKDAGNNLYKGNRSLQKKPKNKFRYSSYEKCIDPRSLRYSLQIWKSSGSNAIFFSTG